jgi:hypothetical protein
MTTELLTPAQSSALSTLPLLSSRVLLSLLESLYAEPGYSCTSAADIAKDIDVPVSKVKGAVSSLVQKGLVEAVAMEANNEVLPLLYSDLHRDRDGRDGDAIRAAAVEMLKARIAVYVTELSGKGGEVDRIVLAASVPSAGRAASVLRTPAKTETVAKDDLEAMAMIAIFGRKAGLGWPVIVAAMGQTLSFTLRLRPVMKRLDPSSVAKLGPAYSAKEAR